MICNLCPRSCNANRAKYSGEGFCKMGTVPKIARVAPHYFEEPCISGTQGCGAIFFSGCTLKCVYCQNYCISNENNGSFVTASELAECYKKLENMGVHSIELVTATHFVDAVIESLCIYKPCVPVIYNCSGYEKPETLKKLYGYIDVYLPDFKYSDDSIALKYSGCKDYSGIAISAIKEMLRQVSVPKFDDNNLIKKGVIVRHLVLPNHTKNSIGVLEILKKHFSSDILVSLMGQYIPWGRAGDFERLNRKVTAREYNKVLDKLVELNLDGFAQELSSADKKYIPQWNY